MFLLFSDFGGHAEILPPVGGGNAVEPHAEHLLRDGIGGDLVRSTAPDDAAIRAFLQLEDAEALQRFVGGEAR